MSAIGIKVKKAEANYDLGASKFFGTPTLPMEWEDDFYDDEIFLCQIRLADIAHLDAENKLPHTGYLYVFIYTGDGKYHLSADVRYFDGEPTLAIDDFNAEVDGYERFNEAYLMEFYPVEEDADCTRLLGVPCDWNYEDEPKKMLMQFDPCDSEMGFLDEIDGFLYFFFGKDTKDFSKIQLWEEYT